MTLASREEAAAPVIKKTHKPGTEPNPLQGLFSATIGGKVWQSSILTEDQMQSNPKWDNTIRSL